MDAIELLMQQHREAEELMERFEQAGGPDERADIATTVVTELRLHTTIEEEFLYPAMREQGGDLEQEVLEDLEEHHAVEVLLDELESMAPSDERFAAKFTVVAELVQHHVEEEEQQQFPRLRDTLGDERLEELGTQMAQRYEQLKSEAQVIDLTKEELYQRAREMGVEGRSHMSKRELAEAVGATG